MTRYRVASSASGRTAASRVIFQNVCCLSTKAASMGVAAMDMLTSLITLIILMIVMKVMGEYVALMLNIALWAVILWMVVRSVLGLVTSVMLVAGIVKCKRTLMLPWLILNAVSIFVWTIMAVIAPLGMVVALDPSNSEGGGSWLLAIIIVCILLSFGVVFVALSFLIPYSHYQILLDRDELRSCAAADGTFLGSSDGTCIRNGANADPASIPLTEVHGDEKA